MHSHSSSVCLSFIDSFYYRIQHSSSGVQVVAQDATMPFNISSGLTNLVVYLESVLLTVPINRPCTANTWYVQSICSCAVLICMYCAAAHKICLTVGVVHDVVLRVSQCKNKHIELKQYVHNALNFR